MNWNRNYHHRAANKASIYGSTHKIDKFAVSRPIEIRPQNFLTVLIVKNGK